MNKEKTKFRRKELWLFPNWGVIPSIVIGAQVLLVSASAHAGVRFWETVGVSAGIGAVLGASTMPFYDVPEKHVSNVFIGAGAGVAIGMGYALYSKWTTPENSHSSKGQRLGRPVRQGLAHSTREKDLKDIPMRPIRANQDLVHSSQRFAFYGPKELRISLLLVSLTWK